MLYLPSMPKKRNKKKFIQTLSQVVSHCPITTLANDWFVIYSIIDKRHESFEVSPYHNQSFLSHRWPHEIVFPPTPLLYSLPSIYLPCQFGYLIASLCQHDINMWSYTWDRLMTTAQLFLEALQEPSLATHTLFEDLSYMSEISLFESGRVIRIIYWQLYLLAERGGCDDWLDFDMARVTSLSHPLNDWQWKLQSIDHLSR